MQDSLRILLLIAAFLLGLLIASATAEGKPTKKIEQIVRTAAIEHGVDPDLALAIMEVESSGNPKAVGKLGEIGLYQLRPEFHRGVKRGDVRGNVDIALKYLNRLRTVCGPDYGDAYFLCFNRGENSPRLKAPHKTKYVQRVNAIYRERKAKAAHAQK